MARLLVDRGANIEAGMVRCHQSHSGLARACGATEPQGRPGCRFHLDRQWPASEESACAQALLVMHPCARLGGPAEYIHGAHLGCQRGAVRDCKDASGSRRQSERPGRCQSRSAGASRRAPSEDEVPSTQLGLSTEGSLLGGRAKSSARAAEPRCNSFEAATVTKHC